MITGGGHTRSLMRNTPIGALLLGFLMVAQGALTAFWGFSS